MAITKRTRTDGSVYYKAEAVYKKKGKVIARASKVFEMGERAKADDWVYNTLSAMKAGQWSGYSSEPLETYTLKDCYEEWLKTDGATLRQQTYDANKYRMKYLFGPGSPLEKIPLKNVSGFDLDRWFDWLHENEQALKRPSRLTFDREFVHLKKLLNWFKVNKCPSFESPIRTRHRNRIFIPGRKKERWENPDDLYLMPEEVRQFFVYLKKQDPVYSRLAKVMMLTGLGLGEALGLNEKSIDLKRNTITVNRVMLTGGTQGRKFEEGEAKNAHRKRSQIFSKHVRDVLIETLEDNIKRGLTHRESIFLNRRYNRPPSANTVRLMFGNAYKALGRPELGGSTHILRHSFGTYALQQNGGNIEEVRYLLGHTNDKQTRRYAKASIFKKDSTTQKVADFLFGDAKK